MWSGPRNISTAMMRSWDNRPDTAVCDEPFYAHYLAITGHAHPGADEVIAHHEVDTGRVIAWLTGPIPQDRSIFYQKHMAHHLLDDIDRAWLVGVTNCFLIRDPREMLSSLVQYVAEPTLRDTGLPQQVEIFEQVQAQTDRTPPVLDSRDVLNDPRRLLGLLCEAVGVEFTESMLSWSRGSRATDGVWAKYWYHAVEASNSFKAWVPKPDPVPDNLAGLYEQCLSYYELLYKNRLGAQ